jgi:hypothetical protein
MGCLSQGVRGPQEDTDCTLWGSAIVAWLLFLFVFFSVSGKLLYSSRTVVVQYSTTREKYLTCLEFQFLLWRRLLFIFIFWSRSVVQYSTADLVVANEGRL